jgi:hypothetical protein
MDNLEQLEEGKGKRTQAPSAWAASMSTAIYKQRSHLLLMCTAHNTLIVFIWTKHKNP